MNVKGLSGQGTKILVESHWTFELGVIKTLNCTQRLSLCMKTQIHVCYTRLFVLFLKDIWYGRDSVVI